MDWDGKMPSWDLGTVVGPSGGGGGALDLKLGAPTTWKPVVASSSAAPVALPVPQHHHHQQQQQQQGSPAPAKRPRAVQGQQTVPACLVEGCAADLSKCREYHRRHKVCEAHSKTPVVSVAGQQQRFCQQCSRFHLLGEFDEVKRSCRKRLDGHNRRRRKPQPDPLSHGGLFGNHHGATRFASYPQIFSTASMAEPAKWPASTVKMETDVFQDQYYPTLQLNGGASLFHGKGRKHFPFLTDHGDPSAAFSCQPFTITPSSESSSNSSRHSNGKMFAHDGGLADNCALSLLSDNPTPAQIMIPGGTGMKYGNVARLSGDGDVSLTGLSYARVGDKETSSFAKASTATTTSAAASATQLQYHHHGYYHVDQGNSDGAIHAVPFSSW